MDPTFSFDYAGRPFPEGFDRRPGDEQSWAHPSGLTVTVESVSDADTGALEWTLWFENKGDADSAPLTNVCPLDACTTFPDRCSVTTARGTRVMIDDFALVNDPLAPGESKEYAACGSRAFIPFFNMGGERSGAMCALGWTGRWFVHVEAHTGGARVTGGMPSMGFYLRPGERVRTPRVLWMPWRGRRLDAHNAIRRHLVKKMPKSADGQPQAPICFGTWGGMKTATHRKLIEFIREQGFRYDLYWIDAGWYGDDHDTEEFQNFENEDWFFHVGNWRVNRMVHPDGLRPVTDTAHAAGMKVLLWFHSLDCHSHLGWYNDHPEWGRITFEGAFVTPYIRQPYRAVKMASVYMDNPQAVAFIADTIGGLLKEHGADSYREDTSMPSGHVDEPGRDGVGEMKAVANYYRFWDSLAAQNPGLIIDNCGGGGTRIDLETAARSYVFHRSDYACYPGADPISAQVGNHGLGHFLPLPCGGMGGAGDTYAFRSSLNGGKSFSFELKFDQDGRARIGDMGGYPFDWHRQMLEEYQTVKPYLWGDFYPLTECDTATDSVQAYQLDRPDLGRGVIFAFRRQDCETAFFSATPELATGTRYAFEDIEGGDPMDVTGGESLTIAMAEKRSSRLILYRKQDEHARG
jgi:alpha-galactosidase